MALFDEVGEMLTGGSTLGALSGFLGEDNDKTSGLLGMAAPALLGALGKRSAAPGGADAIFDLAQNADDGILDNIGGFLGGGDAGGLGASLVGGLLGSRRGAVESGLAQQSGLGGGIVAKLLPMLAPMIMGMLKKKVMGGGMNAGGLAGMLGDNSKAMRDGGMGGILDMLDGGDDEADNAGFLSGMDRFKDIAGIGGATAAAGAVAGKMSGGLGDAAGKVTGGLGDAAGDVTGKVGAMGSGAAGAMSGAADDFKVKKSGGMMKWLLPLLLVAALVIIGLFACGGGDDDVDVISGSDLGGREISVAVENAYLPFNYIDAATGEAGGWDYAALDAICERLNCSVKWVTADWDGMIQAVSDGQYDVAADGITITSERAQIVDFSDGYINIDQRIIVNKANNDINSAADLEASDCTVGTQTGTTNYDTALGLVGESRIQAFDEFGFAIQALVVNDVCAVLLDETAGQGYLGENREDLKLVGESLSSDELGFIFPKGSDLVGPFNKAIADMKADGTLAELSTEFFGDAFTITYDDIE